MILVLGQTYDTNSFQAFDLDLTNGVNTVAIRATDLAGTLTTTHFDLTLASDAVAPIVQIVRLLAGTKWNIV